MRVSHDLSLQVFLRDGFTCVDCDFSGRTFEGWEFLCIDHFRPDGGNGLENLVTACSRCNLIKRRRVWATREEARLALHAEQASRRQHWETVIQPLLAS